MTPLWQSVILFLNRFCPVGCPSCSAGCTPPRRTEELSPDWLDLFLEKTRTLSFQGFLVWTGGEPFFSLDSLTAGVRKAAALGYASEILTSGAWYGTHPEWLTRFAGIPRLSLRISLDDEHQRTVPLDTVLSLIRDAVRHETAVNFTLRNVPGGTLTPRYYERALQENFPDMYRRHRARSRWIHILPTIPPGDRPWSPLNTPPLQASQKPCPVDFKDIVVGEDGLVYPCCGHFDTPGHERLSAGNALAVSWDVLRERFFGNRFFTTLRTRGPHGICQDLSVNPESGGHRFFQSPCHMCRVIFRRPEILGAAPEPPTRAAD